MDSLGADGYRERLWVPASWWIIGLVVGLSVAMALGFYFGPWVMLGLVVVTALALAAWLLWYGSLRIDVDGSGLRVGGNHVEWAYVGDVTALDAAATHERMGPRADAAAALMTRPYVKTAVEVQIVDAEDPHPYWLVSTRRPNRLAAAAAAARGDRA